MFNVNTRGIQTPNVVVGMAIFAGGLLQFIAGMWEFLRGNVFGATGKFLAKNKFLSSQFQAFLMRQIR
jgi:succinate-acetate transporter protein